MKLAYRFREQLPNFFQAPISKARAKTRLRAWIKRIEPSGLTCFDESIKTLFRWLEETNYFVDRDSSGFVEWVNNKIKVLKRRCYGHFNLEHLFQRIYLDLESYHVLVY